MTLTFPCLNPISAPVEKVVANDYNPNKVAKPEMELLYKSIYEDGLTMPIVTFYDNRIDKYVIVDGFHRYTILKEWFKSDIIPIVVIEKDIKERMASTVRHNRARGVHKVDLQADMVVELVRKGWGDLEVSKELGMSLEEVLRLKQQTGVAEVFKNRNFSKSWVAKSD